MITLYLFRHNDYMQLQENTLYNFKLVGNKDHCVTPPTKQVGEA